MNTKERTEQKEISVCFRSCDTEDWSNDAENTALITEINYSLLSQKAVILNSNNISQFYCIFNQINAALVNF